MTKTLRYAVKHSFPIFISYFPVAIAYSVLMQSAGYNFVWTGSCSLFVLAGSLQYLMVSFFAGGVSLTTVAVMSLLLNSRHIFYGLSFIEKFRSFGPWKYFLIYALTDENYSLHCSHDFEEGVDEKWAYILTSAMTLCYWVVLSILGGLVGMLIPFDTTGIDFALTALFIVILIEQVKGSDNRLPALLAFVSSIVCLLTFGPSNFILPSLLITVALLTILRGRIEPVKKEEKEEN
ncbi:MAG: AzlC family ABC transporter permease [Anaerotignum sp.]|nr:AzlC family ABC transporter permease [Anaerotignum sp.]